MRERNGVPSEAIEEATKKAPDKDSVASNQDVVDNGKAGAEVLSAIDLVGRWSEYMGLPPMGPEMFNSDKELEDMTRADLNKLGEFLNNFGIAGAAVVRDVGYQKRGWDIYSKRPRSTATVFDVLREAAWRLEKIDPDSN